MHKLFAHLFIMAIARATMNHGVIACLISSSKVAHGDGSLRGGIRGGRGIVIPGRTGCLILRVGILHTKLAMQPENGSRISRNMTTLSAAFMMPRKLTGNMLRASILRHHFDSIIRHALYNPFSLSLKLKEFLADILRRRISRIALKDTLRNSAASHTGNGNGNFVCHDSSCPARTGRMSAFSTGC